VTAIVTPQPEEVNLRSPIALACIAHKSLEICERRRLRTLFSIDRRTHGKSGISQNCKNDNC